MTNYQNCIKFTWQRAPIYMRILNYVKLHWIWLASFICALILESILAYILFKGFIFLKKQIKSIPNTDKTWTGAAGINSVSIPHALSLKKTLANEICSLNEISKILWANNQRDRSVCLSYGALSVWRNILLWKCVHNLAFLSQRIHTHCFMCMGPIVADHEWW
jgi:hypothetical protein